MGVVTPRRAIGSAAHATLGALFRPRAHHVRRCPEGSISKLSGGTASRGRAVS